MAKHYIAVLLTAADDNFVVVVVNFRVLDDLEMYEQQRPFTISDYSAMSAFLNNFTYKVCFDHSHLTRDPYIHVF